MDIISTYKYLLCFCKNNWELNKFLNLKIIILFLLIDLFFWLMQLTGMAAVEGPGLPSALDVSSVLFSFV